jgi:hypothetical protein
LGVLVWGRLRGLRGPACAARLDSLFYFKWDDVQPLSIDL